MKCPKCQTELIKGEVKKQKDGTEYFELKCPNCEKRFMDIKMPLSVFGFNKEDFENEK